MKKFYLLTKTLLMAVCLGGGASFAWAENLSDIGSTESNWEGTSSSSKSFELALGKTLTFTFKVSESAATSGSDDWRGYLAVIQESNERHTLNSNTYTFVRSMCDYNIKNGSWNVGALYNENNYGSIAKYTHFVGANVTMTIKRVSNYVEIKTAITKNETTYNHHYVQDLGTTSNLYAFLCADWAKLTNVTAELADNNTIGSTTNNWWTEGSYSDFTTLAAGKTLTYIFKVDESAEGEWNGYCLNLQNSTTIHDVSTDTYFFARSKCDYFTKGSWNAGKYNFNNYNSTEGTTPSKFVNGSTIVMKVRRYGTELITTIEVTKSGTTYTHSNVTDIETTNDIYACLGADNIKLQMLSPIITNTDVSVSNPLSIPVGKKDHSDGFPIYAVASIPVDGVYNMHFVNNAGTYKWENYTIRLVYNNGSEIIHALDVGDFWEDATLATADKSTYNWPAEADIVSKLNGADVTLTIARSSNVVTVTAVHTPTTGDPFVLKYTLTPTQEGFATAPLAFSIVPRWSDVVMYYPVDKVNAEVSEYGWATFSSPYKLDFSSVSGLQAYAVTGHSGTAITKSDALGVVAANAGVLLKGTEGYYTIPVSTGEAYDGTNLMVAGTGASVSAEEGKTKYVLGVSASDEAEFQKIVGTPATVAAGKAYLQFNKVISGARALRMSFGDETAVENVKAAAETMAKKNGTYLENGKIAIYKNGVKFNVAGQQMK